ncbi:hypothetical protein EYF80_067024 [Liparis tanakae]|uniref:Uncharacterized protein n=1 Tax=Liparis tanakae TaxID=230148 RepID=A0A4Z2E266_9TELE|nr:hypothetical protein EYF80_067024 [Liparis tanakae]
MVVELDLALALWRVGLDHDEGPPRHGAVEFPLGPPGAGQGCRRVGGAGVPLHGAGAVNKHIGHGAAPRARGHRHGARRDSPLVAPPGGYAGQGVIHQRVQEPKDSQQSG